MLTLKNVWRDSTRALLLEPFDLLARLCAAIPPPGFHMVRYFGVPSSHSSDRHLVVPKPVDAERFRAAPAAGDQLEVDGNYDFEGCQAGPVKVCTFDGNHTPSAVADGASGGDDGLNAFVPPLTWEFISQF